MRLTEVKVENFRSCNSVSVELGDYNPIVGYNNSGKSNFLRAINWLLRKSALSESDFCDSSTPAIVEGTIDGISVAIPSLPPHQQAQIAPYIHNNKLMFRRRQDAPSTSASAAKLEVLDSSGTWKANPTGIDNALGILFPEPVYIRAMDDAGDDIAKFSAKNTIGLLLKYALETAKASSSAGLSAITNAIEALGTHLNGPNRIAELDRLELEASSAIQAYFAGVGLKIEVPPPTTEDIIKTAIVKITEGSHERNFLDYGHGTQRTVQMALIQLLAAYANSNTSGYKRTAILIDEPELYLHPQAISLVRLALKKLSTSGFQVFFSTHSPLLIESEDAVETMVFWKCSHGHTNCRPRMRTALTSLSAQQNSVDVTYSLKHSSQWLFSETPIVVEGKTERVLLPVLLSTIGNTSLLSGKYAIIESTGSSGSLEIAELFRNLGYRPKVIVDLDFAFKLAGSAGLLAPNDANVSACKAWFAANSQSLGFNLDCQGLPRKGGSMGAEEAYMRMAHSRPNECMNIHLALRAFDIWLWTGGAIESHLGITKTNAARAQFAEDARLTGSVSHARDAATLHSLISWL